MDELRALIEKHSLGLRAEELLALARPAVAVDGIEALPEPPLGASRMGGVPDLPADVPWPMSGDRPMEFYGQLDLTEVAPHDAEGLLPREGWLLVFVNHQTAFFGDISGDCRVLHIVAERDDLVRKRMPPPPPPPPRRSLWARLFLPLGEPPMPKEYEWSDVAFEPVLTLPAPGHSVIDTLRLTEDEWNRYNSAHHEHRQANLAIAQLLGFPYPIQEDPTEELAIELNAVNPDRLTLLMQTGPLSTGRDDEFEGDLYFVGPADSVQAGDFSQVWVQYQQT